jgi:RNA polymerase sigma factor (sigma-70 family)
MVPQSGQTAGLVTMSDVTRILSQIELGDPRAAEQLLPLVYDELRKLAAAKLAHEKPGQTLQATALVHEAYLRLVGGGARDSGLGTQEKNTAPVTSSPSPQPLTPRPSFNSRGHFFGAAAEAMRRILIEQARRKGRLKRGADLDRRELDDVEISVDTPGLDVLDLDNALVRLAAKHPEKAELVKLRYFAGLTGDEAAAVLGISPATADRYWVYARAWLVRELAPDDGK